ncbi:MAG: hypothetical protein HXY24_12820 [Rubrivivax sp.]|nr:hypothetical protein [Rubrivivax sp.]
MTGIDRTALRFDFGTATRIVFGPGRVQDAVSTAAALGREALVVCGRTPARLGG